MASAKHTEVRGFTALTQLVQEAVDAGRFEARVSETGRRYATLSIGGQIGPVAMPDGSKWAGRFTANANVMQPREAQAAAAALATLPPAPGPEATVDELRAYAEAIRALTQR